MSKYIIARGVTKTHRIAYLKRNINIKLTFAVSVKPSNGVISRYASKFIDHIQFKLTIKYKIYIFRYKQKDHDKVASIKLFI